MSQPQLQTHEAKFYLDYSADRDGLAPYWALGDLLINHCDGFAETEVEINGEQWEFQLSYAQSGIAPRPQDDVQRDTLYEWDLSFQGRSQRGGSVNFSPRYPEMQTPDGEQISTPWQHYDRDAGVNAHVQGSNLELSEYLWLIPRALQELAVAADYDLYQYFSEPFTGRIYELERYARITAEQNKKLIQQGGIFQKMIILLADQEGSKAEYSVDNEDRVGKRHAVMLRPADAAELFPQHQAFGRQIKSYLTKNPKHFDDDDALYHPKVGTLFRKSLSGGTIDWSQRDQLLRELDETVLNTLAWSDVPIDVGGGAGSNTVFVADHHFDAQARDDDLPIYQDPTPELEAKQEALLVSTLRDLTSSDIDIVETLAADGGQDMDELEEETGWSQSTIYRAIKRLGGVLESEEGHVRFASRKLAQEVRAIVESVEYQLESAADRVSELLDYEVRQAASSAFDRWLSEYAAEFVPPEKSDRDRPVVRIDTILSKFKSSSGPLLSDAIEQMLDAWNQDGRDVRELGDAILEVTVDGEKLSAPVTALR